MREPAGRASARLLPKVGIAVGRDTAVKVLLGIPLPDRAVPRVLGSMISLCAGLRRRAEILYDLLLPHAPYLLRVNQLGVGCSGPVAYRRRLAELTEDLQEAQSFGDQGRTETNSKHSPIS
ncbi:hypothetical protein PV458_05300 [Streptomyces sp. MN03-5084-2B]|nr:hypothetical protein [Streptomyces sp. MN03-5084-2B]